jgi:anaerobic magnesium-protoporphyrin IX monomethyl ester cyclase
MCANRSCDLDLLLINPHGRDALYQELGQELTAIEPPLWCRLIGGYVRDRGYAVEIIDAEAQGWGPRTAALRALERRPRLIAVIVFGHQPSASTQQMAAASPTIRAIKDEEPDQPIIIIGGHVAALPERTMCEEPVDFACNGEGPITVAQLLDVLRAGAPGGIANVPGLAGGTGIRSETTLRRP